VGTGKRAAAWRDGLGGAFSIPGLILFAGAAGFGALARDAGLSLFNAVFMMGVFFALPAQVVMMDQLARGGSILAGAFAVALTAIRLLPMTVALMPLLKGDKSSWRQVLAVHFIAVTAWIEGMRRLPTIPQPLRLAYFIGLGTSFVGATLAGAAFGFLLAGAVPSILAAALLFMTPVYFFVSLLATARGGVDYIALALGSMLGPVFYVLVPGFDLLLGGIVGGTVAYFSGKYRRRLHGREVK
jgi:predicted branched-subunit amino acid permease